MDKTTTLKDLALFTKNEKQLLAEVGLVKGLKQEEPSDRAINNILNFSKVLSIKCSKRVGYIEMMLN